jgi:hypothetical protein
MSARRPSQSALSSRGTASAFSCASRGACSPAGRRGCPSRAASAWPWPAPAAPARPLACACRRGAFVLAHGQLVVQAGAGALARQLQHLLLLRQRAFGQGVLVLQARPLHVGAHHVGGQQHARGVVLGLRGARLADGGLQLAGVAAEKVQRPAALGLQVAQALHRAAQRRRIDVVAGKALAVEAQRAIDLRAVGRLHHGDGAVGLGHAGTGHAQVRVVLQGLGHQPVQLGVAQPRPPVGGRGQRRGVGVGRGGRQAQRGGVAQGGAGCDAARVGARRQQGCRQRRRQHAGAMKSHDASLWTGKARAASVRRASRA